MSNLDKAKEVIKEHIGEAYLGIFNTRCMWADPMDALYIDDNLQITICRNWCYFEVFGLTQDEFDELKRYYYELREEYKAREEVAVRR